MGSTITHASMTQLRRSGHDHEARWVRASRGVKSSTGREIATEMFYNWGPAHSARQRAGRTMGVTGASNERLWVARPQICSTELILNRPLILEFIPAFVPVFLWLRHVLQVLEYHEVLGGGMHGHHGPRIRGSGVPAYAFFNHPAHLPGSQPGAQGYACRSERVSEGHFIYDGIQISPDYR